jgi:hypothetical protein
MSGDSSRGTRARAGQRRVHAAFVLAGACALAGCRTPRANGAFSSEGGSDAALGHARDLGEGGAAAAIDSPPDDTLPVPGDDIVIRARHLLEAIANDNSLLASDILFPRDGWRITRDAMDPGKDWERRIATPFRSAIHALARRKEDLARAQFVSLELGAAIAQATPARRGWKKPLWTVRGSRLTFVVDGRTRTLPVRELTAWRGAWYVTRLR